MNCIVVDDEPLAREAVELLIGKAKGMNLVGSFGSAEAASAFLTRSAVDLVFLDIQMPGLSGIEFARNIPRNTLVIFTTAHAGYALDSYEVEAVDYLVKPVRPERFQKAVIKAADYHKLLEKDHSGNKIEVTPEDYFFIKADRKIFKVCFKDILYIEGLKDYVVVHTDERKLITAINVKNIHDQLPKGIFVRISKSYIINAQQIASFDNNSVYIRQNEIPIGDSYRDYFFEEFVARKLLNRGSPLRE